jgi:hypothetical protein
VVRIAGVHATLDHLVLAAAALAEGVDHVAALTGAAPVAGGCHASMGTHNALLKLGAGRYLEIIAVDPAGRKPDRPRWFDLDDTALQARIAERPRLVHWVARTDDLDSCLAACPMPLGAVHPMARGAYRWRITIPDDGHRPAGGVLPALIQWDVPAHPADGLPDSPVSLARLEAVHPEPGAVRAALAALRLPDAIEVTGGPEPRIVATLRTPRGLVALTT